MSRTADSMRLDLPETRLVYRVGPTMQEAILALARRGQVPSRRALARDVARSCDIGLRSALYSVAALVEMGLVLDGPVRLSDVGERYVARLRRRGVIGPRQVPDPGRLPGRRPDRRGP
jgi:hypothetical protein